MNDLTSKDANIQAAMLEVISDVIAGGMLLYDGNDLIVFASQQLAVLLPVPKSFLEPGTRLRDLLGAVYDSGGRFSTDSAGLRPMLPREDWVADQLATLWKERSETLERRGPDRWFSYTKRRLSSGYGVLVVRDISDHKKREEQWRVELERVQVTEEVLDNLPSPVTVKDRNLTFVAVNQAAARFLGLPVEGVIGRKTSDIHPPELAERFDAVNRRLLDDGQSVRFADRVTRPDGSHAVIIANKYRIGKPGRHYVVTAMQDVTALVQTHDDVDAVVPDMPSGIIESLLRADLQPDAKSSTPADAASRKVLVISSQSMFLSDALSTLEALEVESSGVRTVEELELFLEMARQSGILIDLVVVDAAMDDWCLQIARQHGVAALPIPAARIADRLSMEVLRRLDDPAEAFDGAPEEDWELSTDARPGVPAIDILVAEDNEVNQIVFSQILEGLGYRYAIATDGEQAVRLWQERSPRLILMDITLPLLSGFEASVRIRGLETLENSIPIIGVLPQAFDRDRDECFASGMNDVILKPISPEALQNLFQTYLDDGEMRYYA